ncbi:MAG: YvrJ family protein [Candidatus Peribacteraceae bacterium]|nr:YvrJ family protein [Candidatus Peribacteraceae bacterium]
MSYEEIAQLISNVGFPIAITLYLLVSQNKIIKENTKAVNELINYLKYRK